MQPARDHGLLEEIIPLITDGVPKNERREPFCRTPSAMSHIISSSLSPRLRG